MAAPEIMISIANQPTRAASTPGEPLDRANWRGAPGRLQWNPAGALKPPIASDPAAPQKARWLHDDSPLSSDGTSSGQDRAAYVVDVHLRLLAEAATDALERQAATEELLARRAELIQSNIGLPWTKGRWS